MKKIFAALLSMVMLFSVFTVMSSAADEEDEGLACAACECCDTCITAHEDEVACYCKCALDDPEDEDDDGCLCADDLSWAKTYLPDWMSFMYWVSRWEVSEWLFRYLFFGWAFEAFA